MGNHLRLAFRHLFKQKVYTALNVTGLAIAMATAFLILLYLSFEAEFDAFHDNLDQIYRITTTHSKSESSATTSATTFYGAGSFLKENFSEVENVTRFYRWPASTGVLFMAENKIYNEKNYVFADKDFFNVFPSFLLKGNASTCLADQNSIAISRRLALKIFGTTDVLGKTMNELDKSRSMLVITAVIADVPENTHLDIDVVRRRDWIPDAHWEYDNDYTYVTLKKNVSIQHFELKANQTIAKAQAGNLSYQGISLTFQPLSDIHLNPQSANELKQPGDKMTIYLLGIVFIIVLVVAWVNHINFETATFLFRIKEVGLRRVIGSSKRNVILQFFTQSICVHLIATIGTLLIVVIVLPYFKHLTGISISLSTAYASSISRSALAFFIAGVLASCLYPTLLFLHADLTLALKGRIGHRVGKPTVRKSLIVLQFTSAIVITAFLIIVTQQVGFMRSSHLNVNLDHILTVYNPTNYSAYEDSLRKEKNGVFKSNLLQHHGIEDLTTSSAIPGQAIGFTYEDLAKRTMSDPDQRIPYKVAYIDYDFIPVFGMKLLAGRNYDPNQSDDRCLVVTESTIRHLGFSSAEQALGEEIFFMEDKWDKWKIIGVLADYRHEAVKTPILPTIFRLHRNEGQMVYYSILINPSISTAEAVAAVEKEWKVTWPEKQFEYFFLDEYYDRQFKSDVTFRKMFTIFAGIAILISALGLLGITLMNVNARLKEVSIRKVLGASPARLVGLLSKDNFYAIVWSVVISLPVTYWVGTAWLTNFSVHIRISWLAIVVPVVVLFLLVALTAGFHTLRAANSNPVDHLKTE